MVPINLEGRTAVVTGSARGIGRAIATRLLDAGATVVLNDIAGSSALKDAHAELAAAYADRVYASEGDVGDPAQARKIAKDAFAIAKRLDILVNNAGILRDALIGMISEDQVNQVIRVNLLGVIHMTQAVARLMARNNSGSIVNISSIVGRNGNRGQLVYGASKAGVLGATYSAAKELAPQGIRVNAVAPGYIQTAMIDHLSPEVHQERLRSIAMGRVGQPEDIADTVLYLASDLSTYVTGQVIGVDGGMVI